MATGFTRRDKGRSAVQKLYLNRLVWPAAVTGVTAHAGGGQTSAFAVNHGVTVVATVASGNDSIKLPASTGDGSTCLLKNAAASNSMQVYGAGTDTINAVASATGVAQAAGLVCLYIDLELGKWSRFLGA